MGLKREFGRLFRSMDFVSRHPALKRHTAEARRLAEVYQQLGMAWEFLALQCNHHAGWRKTREKKRVCKICGTVKGVRERWLLLPRDGKKSSAAAPCRTRSEHSKIERRRRL